MTRSLVLLVVLMLSSGLPFSPGTPIPAESSSPQPTEKLVAAYYFYWYDIFTGRHFVDPDGSDALTDHPPDAYRADYTYTLVSWHRRELEDMMAAHVDVILPVYWGSNQEKVWSISGLQKLVTTEQQMIAGGQQPPKIGMFYDTTALMQQNGGVKPNLTTPAGKALFYSMIADFFAEVPQNLWAVVEGRPIIWLYTTEWVSGYDQSTFTHAAQQFQARYGVTPYFVREASWGGIGTDGLYHWGVALNGPMTLGAVGSLGPGYDESAVYGRPSPARRDRECGEFYADGWEVIRASDARLVGIETWNEFHEGTDAAPSREYGRFYVDQTRLHGDRWKAETLGSGPVVWIDLGRTPTMQGLRTAFNLPDGAWRAAWRANREAAYPDLTTNPPSYYIYLDVNDAFMHAVTGEVWVTVEYLDAGSGIWGLEYDSTGNPYQSQIVTLTGSGQWRRRTFHLTDAYFGGRENNGADLRLSSVAWNDSQTDYFGRVWVSKSPPAGQAPDLLGLGEMSVRASQVTELPLAAADPDGGAVALMLERAPAWVQLTDHGNGTGVLRLAPALTDANENCQYRVRVLARDDDGPGLADAAMLYVRVSDKFVYLPLLIR